MSGAEWIAYVLACIVVAAVPGPSVSLIVASSLRHGPGAGLANVVGTQAGFAMLIGVLAAGFQAVLVLLAPAFDWLRLLGAAYLVWLGLKMMLARGQGAAMDAPPSARTGFWRGFLVLVSNPKVLLFFGAFLPQFVSPGAGAVAPRILLLGAVFMLVTFIIDSTYALAAGRAGSWLSSGGSRTARTIGGAILIGGGAWLASSRR